MIGQKLVKEQAKVSITRKYIRELETELLYPNGHRPALDYNNAVPLLTEHAERGFRKFIIETWPKVRSWEGISQGILNLTVRGHAVMCMHKTLVGEREVPCVIVADGRDIQYGYNSQK